MLAHQNPSFHQSLLSGFVPDGLPLVPAPYAGPWKPTSAVATPGAANATTPQRMAHTTTALPLIVSSLSVAVGPREGGPKSLRARSARGAYHCAPGFPSRV